MAVSTSFKEIKRSGGIMMKKKDIKKIMKHQIESHIPTKSPLIDFQFEKSNVQIEEIKQPRFNFKLVLSSVMAIFIIAFIIVMLPKGNVNPPFVDLKLKDDNQVLSFSAVSSISLLSTLGNNELVSYNMQTNSTTESPLVTYIMPYIKSAEKLFLSESGLNVVTQESSMSEYEYMMTFETKNLLGKSMTYEMHYNSTLQSQDDEESEYELDGILIQGSNTHKVTGQKEIEDDEVKIRFRAYKDESSYVESVYKIENDQQTFTFKVFQYNKQLSESKFKIEYEDDETKIELEFVEGDNKGDFKFEYFTEDNENYIKIEFETEIDGIDISGEMVVRMETDNVTGNIIYHFMVNPDDDDPYEYDVDDDDDDEDEEDNEEDD